MDVCILSRRSRRYKKKDTWEDDMIMDGFDGQLTIWHIDWSNNNLKLWSDLELMANNKQQPSNHETLCS